MCGIVGYIGNENSVPYLLRGLSKLEYRGYDSAGIAYFESGDINIIKSVGKLSNLERKVNEKEIKFSHLGIGHTRWATHGKANAENAHPHSSGRFVLVHNGIIENESALREKYLKNTEFSSETDTEVIACLLDKFAGENADVTDAIKRIINELEGSYALGITDRYNPDVLYAVKNKSPLLIGKGNGFNVLGSDAMAMLEKTDTFYEIFDKEYAVITKDEVKIYNFSGVEVKRDTFISKLDLSDTEKGAYPHYMLKEIEEQSAVIRRLIEHYYDSDGSLNVDKNIINEIKNADKIYIVACGTSYHAGLIGKYYLENIAKIETDVYISSEFVYNMPFIKGNPLFILISQSGETADSRAALVKLKQRGYKCLTITNTKGSTLSRESDYTMLFYAGPEIAVASTKAYTSQVSVMAILACAVNNSIGIDLKHELSIVANVLDGLFLEKEKFKKLAHEYLLGTRNCFYIGRGLDYYVSMEAALKLKEVSYIQTEGFAAGELKHGTIALIEKNTPVIAINTFGNTNFNTRSNIKEVKSRGANVLCISVKRLSSEDDRIIIDDVNEYLTPIVAIVPAHYLSYYASLERGCDIDKPRNLAKSVTVE